MQPLNLLGYLLKIFTGIAVIGILILSIGVYLYSFFDIIKVINMILFEEPENGEVILKALKAIDSVLLGVMFFIIGLGLFELFIQPISNLPEWFKMKDIDTLKAMLVKVVVVVMGVSFTGRIVTWDGETDLLGYGLGLGAVVLALSYFLKVKMAEKAKS
ncbi:MAG: YqhA family protein [Bacteroidota bacterium]